MNNELSEPDGRIVDYEARIAALELELFILQQQKSQTADLKYQSLFYNAPIGILHYDKHGIITDCNDVFVKLIGSTRDKLIGLNMICDLRDKKIIHAVRKALTEGYSTYEDMYESVTADKKTRVKIVFKGIENSEGVINEGIGIVEDISLQYQAQQKIEISEQVYRNIFEQNAVGIAHFNTNSQLHRANPRFAEILGYSIDELFSIDFKDITHPQDIELDKKYLLPTFKNELSEFCYDKRFIHKDNHIIWTKISGRYVKDILGDNDYVIIAIIDITPQKEVETELVKQKEKFYNLYSQYLAQNHQLKKYVHQLELANQKLKSAKEKAEEADRLKTSFLTNLSHEIRTPMNGILGFTSILSNKNLTTEQNLKYRSLILQSGDRLLSVINAIVDMSKIEAGITELNITEFNLIVELEAILKKHIPEIQKKQLDIQRKFPTDENLPLTSDLNKFEQIISALIKNAIKFTDQGQIELNVEHGDDEYTIGIKDTGIGISPEHHQIIFNSFRQAPNPSKFNEGAGLGLSIAKGLTHQLQGELYLESDKDRGAAFYITLPKSISFKQNVVKDESDKTQAVNKLTILVVEDEPMNFILIEEFLSNLNCDILHAVDGENALSIINQNHKIDMVLMDIKLPGINGIEVTKAIRRISPTMKIIAVTAYTPNDSAISVDQSIFDAYITKPVNGNLLLDYVHRFAPHN